MPEESQLRASRIEDGTLAWLVAAALAANGESTRDLDRRFIDLSAAASVGSLLLSYVSRETLTVPRFGLLRHNDSAGLPDADDGSSAITSALSVWGSGDPKPNAVAKCSTPSDLGRRTGSCWPVGHHNAKPGRCGEVALEMDEWASGMFWMSAP